eukprot:3087757-Amphidinium_carterae.1
MSAASIHGRSPSVWSGVNSNVRGARRAGESSEPLGKRSVSNPCMPRRHVDAGTRTGVKSRPCTASSTRVCHRIEINKSASAHA